MNICLLICLTIALLSGGCRAEDSESSMEDLLKRAHLEASDCPNECSGVGQCMNSTTGEAFCHCLDSRMIGETCSVPYADAFSTTWNAWNLFQISYTVLFLRRYAQMHNHLVSKDKNRGAGVASTQLQMCRAVMLHMGLETIGVISKYAMYPTGLEVYAPWKGLVESSYFAYNYGFIYTFALATHDGVEKGSRRAKKYVKLKRFCIANTVGFFVICSGRKRFLVFFQILGLFGLWILCTMYSLICRFVKRGLGTLKKLESRSTSDSYREDVRHLIKQCSKASALYYLSSFLGIFILINAIDASVREYHYRHLVFQALLRSLGIFSYYSIGLTLQGRNTSNEANDEGCGKDTVVSSANDSVADTTSEVTS